jgi:hypothetical protein
MSKSWPPRTRKQLDKYFANSERTLRYGWHLCGVGPARYGWASYSPAGACDFEGKSIADVARRVKRHIEWSAQRGHGDS